jgi:hypothetical protein
MGTTAVAERDLRKSRRIILLNGPPGSGKDTLAEELQDLNVATHCCFKEKLFAIALEVSGISRGDWFYRYHSRVLKETPWDRLGGLSQRQFLIRISEEWVKPTFGEAYFGEQAVELVDSLVGDIVFSDSGFQPEAKCLIDAGFSVHVVRLYRDGCSFDGDSRSYLSPQELDASFHSFKVTDGDPKRDALGISRCCFSTM